MILIPLTPLRSPLQRRKAGKPMDITLHLGAHRTATTSFQYYLRENARDLARQGVEVWGPWRTRDGVLTGVVPVPGSARSPELQLKRARGRIALGVHRAQAKGLRQILVSDENMIGAPRRNLRDRKLYSDIGQRMARYAEAFQGRIRRVVISPRAQDTYWASVLAFAVERGHHVPDTDELDRLVTARRDWRDVISDLACALPEAELLVMPYEQFGGRPEAKLTALTGLPHPPMIMAREWNHRAPGLMQLRQVLDDRGEDPGQLPDGEGRWQPFDTAQTTALREAYADDMFWLRAGADGLANLIEETGDAETGTTPRAPQTQRGQRDGIEERRLA